MMKIISKDQPITFRATGKLKTSIESYVKALIEVVFLLDMAEYSCDRAYNRYRRGEICVVI